MTPEETKRLCDFFTLLFEIDRRVKKEKRNIRQKVINLLVLLAQKKKNSQRQLKNIVAMHARSTRSLQI